MLKATQIALRLVHLCLLWLLWLLVRFTHFALAVSGLNWEACEVSNAEGFILDRIQERVIMLAPEFVKG